MPSTNNITEPAPFAFFRDRSKISGSPSIPITSASGAACFSIIVSVQVPALGYRWLTPFYDSVVRLTSRSLPLKKLWLNKLDPRLSKISLISAAQLSVFITELRESDILNRIFRVRLGEFKQFLYHVESLIFSGRSIGSRQKAYLQTMTVRY